MINEPFEQVKATLEAIRNQVEVLLSNYKELEMTTFEKQYGKMLPAPYDEYSVTEDGRKVFRHHSNGKVREISQWLNKGYLSVRIFRSDNGRQQNKTVHNLVALAWIGERPQGLVLRHLNGDPFNNHWTNLAYGSQRDNIQDAILHGTFRPDVWSKGEKNGNAKLTTDEVREIRLMRSNGLLLREIQVHFPNVSRSAIGRICNGKRWPDVV